MQETQVRSLDGKDLLEEEMATHSSILAWRILQTKEPGGLQSGGLDMIEWLNTKLLKKNYSIQEESTWVIEQGYLS